MRPERIEIAVVGAGPAGAAAALSAAEAGCRVTVIDAYAQPGGQYLRERAVSPPGGGGANPRRGADTKVAGRPQTSRRRLPKGLGGLPARLRAHSRVDLRLGQEVWTAEPGPPHVLHTVDPEDPSRSAVLEAEHVVLATGAVDRVLPFPGWDLPGVLTAGGAQALLKGQGLVPGSRAIVAGSGPFLLPVAAGLAAAGCRVPLVAESARLSEWGRRLGPALRQPARLREAAGYALSLARGGVRVRHGHAVVEARGDDRVEEVVVAAVDRRWSPVPGSGRVVSVDAACVSFGFVPQVALALLLGCEVATEPLWGDPAVVVDAAQATSVPHVAAAGEVAGVAGAHAALAEGVVAGLAAARACGRLATDAFAAAVRRPTAVRDRTRRFADALADVYRIGDGWVDWLTPDTTVCRCEEVSYASVRAAVNDGATDLRSVKMTTRCGMGMCQARMCGPAVARLVEQATGRGPPDPLGLSTRPILVPVPLGTIARSRGAQAEAGAVDAAGDEGVASGS